MAQLVARLSGGQEAVSSSLATPTNKKDSLMTVFFIGWIVNWLTHQFTYERSEYCVALA